MFARVETYRAQPDELDELLTGLHHTVGRVRTIEGNMGGYVLVNRDRGQLLNVTFWRSEEDESAPSRGEVVEYAIAMQEALSP